MALLVYSTYIERKNVRKCVAHFSSIFYTRLTLGTSIIFSHHNKYTSSTTTTISTTTATIRSNNIIPFYRIRSDCRRYTDRRSFFRFFVFSKAFCRFCPLLLFLQSLFKTATRETVSYLITAWCPKNLDKAFPSFRFRIPFHPFHLNQTGSAWNFLKLPRSKWSAQFRVKCFQKPFFHCFRSKFKRCDSPKLAPDVEWHTHTQFSTISWLNG